VKVGDGTLGDDLREIPESSFATEISSACISICSLLFEGNSFARLSMVLLLRPVTGVF